MASRTSKNDLLRLGVEATQNGQRESARVLFQQVLQQDPTNLRANLYMAKVAANVEERQFYLRQVLTLDPNNEAARNALNKIQTSDTAARNKLILRVGVITYVIGVLLVSILMMVFLTG